MRFLWDFIVILTIIAWIVALFTQGYISPFIATLVLLLTPVILALGRGFGGGVGRTMRFLFRIGIPLASLATLLIILSGGGFREFFGIIGNVLALFLVLVGFYFMFYGLFSRKKH